MEETCLLFKTTSYWLPRSTVVHIAAKTRSPQLPMHQTIELFSHSADKPEQSGAQTWGRGCSPLTSCPHLRFQALGCGCPPATFCLTWTPSQDWWICPSSSQNSGEPWIPVPARPEVGLQWTPGTGHWAGLLPRGAIWWATPAWAPGGRARAGGSSLHGRGSDESPGPPPLRGGGLDQQPPALGSGWLLWRRVSEGLVWGWLWRAGRNGSHLSLKAPRTLVLCQELWTDTRSVASWC